MKKLFIVFILLSICVKSYSSPPTRSFTYTSGTTITAADVTTNEDNIYNYLQAGVDTINDGSVVNADIAVAAGIPGSKLDLSAPGAIGGSAPSAATFTDITGTDIAGTGAATLDDATNQVVLIIDNDGTNIALNIQQDGILAGGKNALYIQATAANVNANSAMVNLIQDNASSTEPALEIRNDGSGAAIEVTAGYIINSDQPCFSVKPTSDQSNIATGESVTVIWGTEIFDQGDNFTSNTFTAPVTGKYQLSFSLSLAAIDSAATDYQFNIVTSNRTYEFQFDPTKLSGDPVWYAISNSVLADMDINDTAHIVIAQTGGTAQTDISANSFFTGALLF